LVNEVVTLARRSARSAAAQQSLLTGVSTAVEAHRVPGVKAAAALIGLHPGYPRKPLRPLPKKHQQSIRRVLGEAGII
jgi:dihydrodipicolinate synthase/N-acetylneuraminate lyase